MVYSNIHTAIFYKEERAIFPEDIGYESLVYQMEMADAECLALFGKAKYTYADKNIIFFPIYLVNNQQKVVCQIGVLEIHKNHVIDILNDDGNIDVDKLDNSVHILTYDFVDRPFIEKNGSSVVEYIKKLETGKNVTEKKEETDIDKMGTDEDEDEDEDDVTKVKIPSERRSKETEKVDEMLEDGIFVHDPTEKRPALLSEETDYDDKVNAKEYKKSKSNEWIEDFMKNNNYGIHAVEDNGNCLFAVIRDAYKQIGQTTTVEKLRAILAREITDDRFQEHRSLFLDLKEQVRQTDAELARLKYSSEIELKKRAQNAKKYEEATKILEQKEENEKKYKALQKYKKSSQDFIDETVGHLESIDTLEKYREFIQTPRFWADEWAISVLERVLQMKMVILSERSFLEDNTDGVLQCGMIDNEIQKQGGFSPKYYIIATFSGNHYRLVTYKDKKIFEYHEIPYKIKAMVINKCMERNSGPFYMIQDFRNLKTRMGIDADEGKPREKEEENDEDVQDEFRSAAEYDPEIVFQFGETQPIVAEPGKASNEKIPTGKRKLFIVLSKIREWRRKLDDSWTGSPFALNGHKWASVEHYHLASKFKKQNPDFMLQFTLDNEGSEIAKDVDLARAAASKTGVATGKAKAKLKNTEDLLLRPKNIRPDPDFEGERSQIERIAAVRAKFTQNIDMKNTLKATGNAKLVKFIRRDEAEKDYILMNVRKELKIDE